MAMGAITRIESGQDGFAVVVEIRSPTVGRLELTLNVKASSYATAPEEARRALRQLGLELVQAFEQSNSL